MTTFGSSREAKTSSSAKNVSQPAINRASQTHAHGIDRTLALQGFLGNQAVQQRTAACPAIAACPTGGACHQCPARVQTKLVVNQPGDAYEQEADRVAETIMRMPDVASNGTSVELGRPAPVRIQRACTDCEEELRRQPVGGETTLTGDAANAAPTVTPELNSQIAGLRGGGTPLPEPVRAFFEPRFGYDLGHVRIHHGPQATDAARALQARAFTIGRNIVFGPGEYSPETSSGRQLIAHELVHVAQQGGGDSIARSPAARGPGAPAILQTGHVPAGLVQRHEGPPCPPVPPFRPVSARPRAVWQPANDAIEQAYVNDPSHAGHSILTGSQFEYGGAPGRAREVRLPRGAPNQRWGNELLERLRGVSRQLAPDIIDFTDRTFYEIKSLGYAVEGAAQLRGYYQLAGEIQREIGGPAWNQDLATWYPPHVLPLPGSRNRLVCTQATDYQLSRANGLIVYQVLERPQQEDEERQRQAAQAAAPQEEQQPSQAAQPQSADLILTQLHPEIRELAPRMQIEMRRSVGQVPVGSRYLIVAPPVFYRQFIEVPQMERTLERMRVHGLDPRRNPVIGFRNLGWTLVGIYAATMAVTFWGGAIAGLAAAAPTVAAGAGTSEVVTAGAVVIRLARPAAQVAAEAAAKESVRQLAKAAGVLIVIGIGREAEAANFELDSVEAVRAVPVSAVTTEGQSLGLGAEVRYQGKPYRVIGAASVPQP